MSKPTTSSTPTMGTQPVPHEKVAARAYENWVKRGRPQGTPEQDWIQAEQEIRAEISKTGTPPNTRR